MRLNTDRLLALAEDRGWSQADLARKVGVSRSAVTRWIAGQRQPGSKTIEKLLKLAPIEVLFDPEEGDSLDLASRKDSDAG